MALNIILHVITLTNEGVSEIRPQISVEEIEVSTVKRLKKTISHYIMNMIWIDNDLYTD